MSCFCSGDPNLDPYEQFALIHSHTLQYSLQRDQHTALIPKYDNADHLHAHYVHIAVEYTSLLQQQKHSTVIFDNRGWQTL